MSRYLQKSKYSEPRQKFATVIHRNLLYIIGSYGLGRKPISPLCTRPFRQVNTACTCPSFPLCPLPMLLQSIVLSLLVPSSLFRHLSGWQVRSFVDTSFVGDHSFPRTKAKPPSSAQLLRSASPASLQGCFKSRPLCVSRPQSLSQTHISILVWQPGYCHRTFFRLAGRFLTHVSSLQRPSSSKTQPNVTRPSIQASC